MKVLLTAITLSRIFLSPLMLFVKPLSFAFYILYTICGISDVLDGYLARKTGNSSNFGAKLDSFADLFMAIMVSIVFLPLLWNNKAVVIVICMIAFIRIVSLIIVFIKFHTFSGLHTYMNKLTGLSIFLAPYFIPLVHLLPISIIICFIAFIASLEELLICMSSEKLDPNRKSLFL